MNELTLLFATNPSFRLVKCSFKGSAKTYTYKTTLELTEGDTVIVNAPGGLTCVEVIEINQVHEVEIPQFDLAWIVQKVDTTEFEKLKEIDKQVRKQLNESKTAKLIKEMQKQLKDTIGAPAVKSLEKLVRL